jgi:hypothetical protein
MNDRRTIDSEQVPGIGSLPRAIEPAQDLWPGIEARLVAPSADTARRVRGWRLGAIAASVAAAFLVGILLGRQGPAPGSGMTPAAGLPVLTAGAAAVAATLEATEREYQAVWKGFDPAGLPPSALSPETVDALQRTWESMHQAETALMTALDEHPENPYLAQKLLELRGQQLEFMRELYMLDQNSRRET